MSEPSGELAELAPGLTQLTSLLLSVENVEEALRHLARMAVIVIPDGPSCAITVNGPKTATTIVHAGPAHASVRELQYKNGQGPSLEAMRNRSRIVVQDLTAERRWGEWPRAAVAAGVYGVCVFPLEGFGKVVGGLSLYAHEPDMFPEPVQQIAAQFVEPAALLLAGVIRHLSQAELIDRLRAGLTARGVIDQAIGIIMAHGRCSPDEAFGMLRKISNDRNIKVRTLATELVTAVATGAAAPAWAPYVSGSR